MSQDDRTRALPRMRGTRGAPASGDRRVGPYRIEGELGRGGMGVVHRAFDERLHREVALKALPDEFARDAEQLARLEREARSLAAVSHPNVASIFGMEEAEGVTYLVLELVEGETLRERLERGALPPDEALALCAQVAAGLEAVHRKGLVHRDLKPGNVMVTPEGVAKLLDFGLARQAREQARGEVTRRGEVLGTPGWMSPEQLRGEELDARSDAFAWGCLLYECLASAPAFPGETWMDRDAATLTTEPDWSLLLETSSGVLDLVRSCLSKDRAGRPATLAEARRALEDARQPSSGRQRAGVQPKHSLPAEHDAFVGREAELSELLRLLDEGHRLVSVLGIGGTGKTRLVLRHAWRSLARFPGGAWFCDLSEARSVEGIAHAVARTLDVPLGKGDPIVQLGHVIAGRGKCLVILDNFEQVARHAGETLGRWLDRVADASFMVTTREVLGVPGEQSIAIAPMEPADASALFVARARAVRRDFAPDDAERAEINRLVKLLDHLPLAIELAAARVRIMPPRVLLERMGERFKLLAGSGARLTRQATLRAAFDWSWELLSDDERAALAQLSVFEGGFTLEAAEVVLSLTELWPADAVQALVDKSWVRPTSEGRFDLLVSVQEYAAEKLDALGGRAGAEVRHGTCFAALGTDDALTALASDGGVALRRAQVLELDNLVAACRRATARQDAETAVVALEASWAVLGLCGPFVVGEELTAGLLALPLSQGQRAKVSRTRGHVLTLLGRGGEARACFDTALAIAREVGDRSLEGIVLGNLGAMHDEHGQPVEARACDAAALAIYREVGNRRVEGITLMNLGLVHADLGRMDDARACFDAALAIHREVGNRRFAGMTLGNLGIMHEEQGRLEEARACQDAALAITREVGDRHSEGFALGNLGAVHSLQGRLGDARACYDAALAIHREVGNRRGQGIWLAQLGELNHALGRLGETRACYDAALAIHREVGDRRFEGITLGNLAFLHQQQGRLDETRACLEEAEPLLRELKNPFNLGKLRCHRARLESREGHADAARASLAEAESLAARAGAGPDSALGRLLAAVRALVEGGTP